MIPLVPADVPQSEIQGTIDSLVQLWREGDEETRSIFPEATTEENVREQAMAIAQDELRSGEVWINDQYQVHKRECGEMTHLSVKRLDKAPVRDWRDMQAIKNQLVGEECEAVELYPAESRLVDTANQFHLWCCNKPTFRFPFGFNSGRVVHNKSTGKTVQRPR